MTDNKTTFSSQGMLVHYSLRKQINLTKMDGYFGRKINKANIINKHMYGRNYHSKHLSIVAILELYKHIFLSCALFKRKMS